jgi:hypothetical protein
MILASANMGTKLTAKRQTSSSLSNERDLQCEWLVKYIVAGFIY